MLKTKIIVNDNGLIQRFKVSKEVFNKEAKRSLSLMLAYIFRIVRAFTPRGATGFLRGSIFTTNITGDNINLTGSVTTNALYGSSVEFGTKPHMPPVNPIILWVKRKLKISDSKKQNSIAWAIAVNIKKQGTKGAFMFSKALRKSETYIKRKKIELEKRLASSLKVKL